MKRKWDFELATDIQSLMTTLVRDLEMNYIDPKRVFCVRSNGSSARAYARIWGLSRIFQMTAGYEATYVIEVLSQHFDKLDPERQKKVVIHELLHIPHTFSGSLRSHKGRNHSVDDKTVERLYQQLKK
jgi:predicted metallopeptidase